MSASFNKSQLKAIKSYCKSVIQDELSKDLKYHGWAATKANVVTFANLAKRLDMVEEDADVVRVALYFLYTGFVKEDLMPYEGSLIIARNYLNEIELESNIINRVIDCIKLKVEDDVVPTHITQKVFYDTVYAYYGESGLKKRITTSWEERNFLRDEKVDLLTTLERRLDSVNRHTYHTNEANKLYEYKKSSNIIKLKATIDKEKNKNNLSSNKTAMTMFKTALRNHIDLINIADKKAGIMISINAILMTLMIPILGSYIIDVTRFIIPSIILILTCGIAVILATLATRPQLADGNVDEQGKLKGEKSLFYFGNFFEMEKSSYRSAVKDVIVRDITLENSIINDLYDMGVVLGVKYKRLRWCYLIFAGGVGLTLVTFIISFFLFPEI